MIARRDVALGGLLTISWLAASCGCAAHAASEVRRFGCELAEDDAIGVQLKAMQEPLTRGSRPPKFVESGDRDLDYALAQTLSMLTDTWNVLPAFAYYRRSATRRTPSPAAARWLSRADGTVLFGRRLLDALPQGARASRRRRQRRLCARVRPHRPIQERHQQALREGEETAKRLELHADFLAGYFAGHRKLQKPGFPAAVYATTQYSAGDYRIDNPKHHGRPDERAAAVVKGFETVFPRSPLDERGDADRLAATLKTRL